MNDLTKLLELMTKRLEEIESGMKKEGASVQEQKHLDKGSSERAYWHHGYASALRDLLKSLESRNARHAA
jgi:hypothetical protein